MKVLIEKEVKVSRYNLALLCILFVCFYSCNEIEVALPNEVIEISGLKADKYEVSIGEFRGFVEDTDYVTTADSLKWSGVFDIYQKNWVVGDRANWEKPDGRNTLGPNYPATHMSYFDACAYCRWKGGRLPSAAEWDMIAGDSVITGNVWEGLFPYEDSGNDGYHLKVAPRGQFKPNTTGLYDIFGNVWEWTSSIDEEKSERIIKGGSFLCDYNVCAGYIPSRFQTTPDDSGLNHLGFRCVYE